MYGLTLLGLLAGGRVHATGNLEATTGAPDIFLPGAAIVNTFWPPAAMPIPWVFHHPLSVASCQYNSANAPPFTLQAAVAAAFDTWESSPGSSASFIYAGQTPVRNVGADGLNIVTFCDEVALTGAIDFLAYIWPTILTETTEVLATGGCPPGQGLLDLNGPHPPDGFCIPAGVHPPGTLIDVDISFNTYQQREQFNYSTNGTALGTFDVEAMAVHEIGHFIGLSHDPITESVMLAQFDDIPASDGIGKRSLRQTDIASAARYYRTPEDDTESGSITGRITIDGVGADGIHVVAIDPETMLGVAGRFSISHLEDPSAHGTDGPDSVEHGAGFYRLDGLPPGNYYVYAEFLDWSEFISERLHRHRYNATTIAANTWPGSPGWTGFTPSLPEFYNIGDSSNGGDGLQPGSAEDNADAASLLQVVAGATTADIDIALNIVPANGAPPYQRSDPTLRAVFRNDEIQAADRITGLALNGGSDDFYAIRFPAEILPPPPYNVAEGLWARVGRNTASYVNRLVFASPSDPGRPALNDPVVPSAGRVLTGGPGGLTAAGDWIDVRDQWNVTINEPRDIWIILNQPPTSLFGLRFLTQGFFPLVTRTQINRPRVGRSLVTQNGGATWASLPADVLYQLFTESAPPTMITAAEPPVFEQGQRGAIDIVGVGFAPGLHVDLGPSITVTSTTFIDSTRILAELKIADTGSPEDEAVNVIVSNPDTVFPNVSRVFRVVPSTNRQPAAVISAPATAECASPSGSLVMLDGSGSTDPDSTPGTNDDILSWEWIEDDGLPSSQLLGTGSILTTSLTRGQHAITLLVSDSHDAVDSVAVVVDIVDSTSPTISADAALGMLWPPDHRMVDVTFSVSAHDTCSPVSWALVSLTSSEPDDAPGGGDGATVNDIQGTDFGTPDITALLRAERLGSGAGRVYAATYLATDESGNTAQATATVLVPHSAGGDRPHGAPQPR